MADGGELDAPLEGPDEPIGLPPADAEFDEGAEPDSGRSAGTLLRPSPQEGAPGPVRGQVPFANLRLSNFIYVAAWLDSQSKKGRSIYQGMSVSQVLEYYLEQCVVRDVQQKLADGSWDGLVNAFGDLMLRVARISSRAALTELYDSARDSIITTLVDRNIADRARLEEVLGVTADALP